jgi:hypothetical protein
MRKAALRSFVILCLACSLACSSLPREVSTTRYEGYVKTCLSSASLGRMVNVNIYLPPEYSTKTAYPVLYMLHGYTDNEDKWMPKLSLERNARDLILSGRIRPLIIVMPQIDNSFGLNTALIKNLPPNFTSGMYEDYLIKELIPYIDATYSTARNREGRYVGGLSMGGAPPGLLPYGTVFQGGGAQPGIDRRRLALPELRRPDPAGSRIRSRGEGPERPSCVPRLRRPGRLQIL